MSNYCVIYLINNFEIWWMMRWVIKFNEIPQTWQPKIAKEISSKWQWVVEKDSTGGKQRITFPNGIKMIIAKT